MLPHHGLCPRATNIAVCASAHRVLPHELPLCRASLWYARVLSYQVCMYVVDKYNKHTAHTT